MKRRATGVAAIARGQEALARREWQLARASFEEALHVEETPEALEGLGMAAWWLDDDVAVFDARERSYRLYRRRGDRRGAGRVAMALAEDCLQLRGEAAVGRGWHQRAHRLLDGLEPIPEQGWLKFWEGDLALASGDSPARARSLAVEAAALARQLSDVDLEMTALALEGLALVVDGDVPEGMPRLDEATTAATSGEMTHPVAIGLSCCYLVTACERIRDFARAAQWCQRVREFCERTRFHFLLAVCRTQYAGVLTWMGSWPEAERELESVLDQLGANRPALRHEALVRLADLRRHQGRLDEAGSLLKQVDGGSASGILSRAALALEQSDPSTAAHLARRFLRQLPPLGRTDRMMALDVLLRAQVAAGDLEQSRTTLDELRSIAATVDTPAVKATALVGEGLVASSGGAYDDARNAFEDALDLLSRSGASVEMARCRVELARVVAAMGDRDVAATELHEAVREFERLGSTRNVATATRLLRDLQRAVTTSSDGLTRREVEVLRLVARGLSNPQIAKQLGVSVFTIKRHVANVLAKLDLPSRAAAAAFGARKGLT